MALKELSPYTRVLELCCHVIKTRNTLSHAFEYTASGELRYYRARQEAGRSAKLTYVNPSLEQWDQKDKTKKMCGQVARK